MNGLGVIPVTKKTGGEAFVSRGENLSIRLSEFWSWARSDLVNNVARGVLAEFLVAHALDIVDEPRTEWDAKDLVTKDGTTIEVKSSAYVQSWKQKKHSKVTFKIAPKKRAWDATTDKMTYDQKRYCDVYVFCLLDRKNDDIDPMNMDHWVFYVVSSHEINECLGDKKSVSLSTLEKLPSAKPISYDDLKQAVEGAKKQVLN